MSDLEQRITRAMLEYFERTNTPLDRRCLGVLCTCDNDELIFEIDKLAAYVADELERRK